MAAFYKATVGQFLATPSDHISGALSERIIQSFAGDESKQLEAWKQQIEILKSTLRITTDENQKSANWGILFEFPMLRLQRRLDIVLLAGDLVVVIEFKVGAGAYLGADLQQVEDYALDLRDFHEASHDLAILPMLCATSAELSVPVLIPNEGVGESWTCNEAGLTEAFCEIAN